MYPSLHQRSFRASEQMSQQEVDAVLASARAIKRAALSAATQPLLRGKNLGLLCEARDSADASLFIRAASELGAHVAHIRPSLSSLKTAQEVRHTARMLGRLYDAVECQGLSSELVRQLDRDAGVPVYDGLASAQHVSVQLASLLDTDGSADDNRRYVLQALLVGTLS